MTSQGHGLPLSVVLIGTIYAIALAVAPTSGSAAKLRAWSNDNQQIAESHGPVAHTAHGISIILGPLTTRTAPSCAAKSDAVRTGPPPALTFRTTFFVPKAGLAAAERLMTGEKTTLF